MTETSGFPFRPEDQPGDGGADPGAADPAPLSDAEAAAPGPVEDVTEPDTADSQEAVPFAPEPEPAAPEPEAPAAPPAPAPFVPSDGVADWLREAIHDLHRRLANLGG